MASRSQCKLWLLLILNAILSLGVATPTPIIITPTGEWEGSDGPWSTFEFGIGYPEQLLRGHPALSVGFSILPMRPDWCKAVECKMRHYFDSVHSDTWSEKGAFKFPRLLFSDSYNILNSTGASETVGIDRFVTQHTNGAIALPQQVFTEFTSKGDVSALIGLSDTLVPWLASAGEPLISSLHKANSLPSLSFSYNAGSVNQNAHASLVFGGYDSSKFKPDSISSFNISKYSYPLSMEISAIYLEGLPDGKAVRHSASNSLSIPVALESATSFLWLPVEVCQTFETFLDLKWDENAEVYLIDALQHSRLMQSNPRITFSFDSTIAGNPTVKNITLPYSTFNLNITFPSIGSGELRYFPLKCVGAMETYLLGRAFLQDAYLSVDYSSQTFNLSQAIHDPHTTPTIVPIIAALSDDSHKPVTNSESGWNLSAIATSLIFGTSLVLFTIGGTSYLLYDNWRIRQKKTSSEKPLEAQIFQKPELDGRPNGMVVEAMDPDIAELEVVELGRIELDASEKNTLIELEVVEPRHELYLDEKVKWLPS